MRSYTVGVTTAFALSTVTYNTKEKMMKRNAARICLVIVTNLVVSVSAELIIKPKDAESVVRGPANFNCSTTDPTKEIQWFHYSYPTREKNMVYGFGEIRGSYDGRFFMKKNDLTGEYNLAIIAVVAQDAGVYECQDEVGYGNISQAQLIVLDAKPACQAHMPDAKVLGKNTCGIEPDTFQLSCTATFRGNIAPVLQWKKVGESAPIAQGVTVDSSDSRVTYNLTLTGGDPAINGSSYICETTKSSTTEQSSCVSDVIRVWSPQNNFSILKKKSGESVQCPTVVENSCSYKWKADKNGEPVVSIGQLVELDASGLYRCEADCRIRTKPCTVLAMVVSVPEEATVAAPQEEDQSATFKVAFVIVLILLIVFIILSLVFLLCWRKGRSQSNVLKVEMEPLTKEPIIAERPSNVSYSPNPTRIHTIKTQSAETLDKSIKGTAILNNELFIISQLDSEVEVYDCTSLALRRRWQLNDLGDPDDATSCIRNRCIYISDNKTDGKEIFRIDADGNIINRWSIGEESGRLSVTDQATVILSLFNSSKLVEYSSDGLLIRVLNLSGHGLTHPMHAIRLINGNFVMTQGYLDDPTHKICEVTSDGKMIRSFGAEKGPGVAQLMNPTYLAVDRDGSILVADAGNGRVMLIGSNLEFKRELITKRNGLHIPTRICLDDINGRLYVAEYKKDLRSLLVFNIR